MQTPWAIEVFYNPGGRRNVEEIVDPTRLHHRVANNLVGRVLCAGGRQGLSQKGNWGGPWNVSMIHGVYV
jgi:hypothetical protein